MSFRPLVRLSVAYGKYFIVALILFFIGQLILNSVWISVVG